MPMSNLLVGGGNDATLDVMFWNTLCKFICPPKRIHVKSIGNKETVLSILNDVDDLNLENITCCIDSDYDFLVLNARPSSRLIRTHGYSWESDVTTKISLEGIALSLLGPGRGYGNFRRYLNAELDELERSLVRWCEIDISLHHRSCRCIFDREKPLRSFNIKSKPKLRVDYLRQRLLEIGYKRAPNRVIIVKRSNVLHVSYGKMVARILYHIFNECLAKVNAYITLTYEAFIRLCVSQAIRMMQSGVDRVRAEHYKSYVGAF